MAVSQNTQRGLYGKQAVKRAYPDNQADAENIATAWRAEGFKATVRTYNDGTKAKPRAAYIVRAYTK